MKLPAAVVLAASLALAGCAATIQSPTGASAQAPIKLPAEAAKRVVLNLQLDPQHPKDSGWTAFRQEWIDIAREQTRAQGIDFDVQDGAPKAESRAGTLLVVQIKDYRHVGIGSRMLAGIMTGNAYINADVDFRDLRNGKTLGERTYNTASSAGQGVFSAMTPKQIYAIVDQMLAEVRRR